MDRETTLLELFQKFSMAIEKIDGLEYITESMKRIVGMPVVSFTSDDENIVLGEVFTVKSPGFYTVVTKGSGKGSYTVKNANTQKTIYAGRLENDETSAVLSLTAEDLCYFHASATSGSNMQISLVQTHSLFDVITEYLRESTVAQFSLNNRIDNIIASVGKEDLPTELVDMRISYWGDTFTTAGARVRSAEERIDKMEQMAFPTFKEGFHDEGLSYKPFTFVHDVNGNSYVSTQAVPPGTLITNTDFWTPWDVRDTQTQILSNRIDQLNNALEALKDGLSSVKTT